MAIPAFSVIIWFDTIIHFIINVRESSNYTFGREKAYKRHDYRQTNKKEYGNDSFAEQCGAK